MIRSVVGWSMRFRSLVAGIAAGILVLGITQLPKASTDVLPEFTPTYVEVQTDALGLSSQEVEQLITVPLEADLLAGVPKVDTIYSRSLTGLSSITLVFEPGTSILDARQLVGEQLTQAHANPNVGRPPTMIQPLSSESRVLMIGLDSANLSPIERSVLARWVIRPRLLGVPGVANVTIWGERARQLQVEVDPRHLRDDGVTLDQIVRTAGNAQLVSPLTFLEASTPGTAGFIDTPNQRLQIRHILPIVTARKLAQVPLDQEEGRATTGLPRQLGDIADVHEGHQPLIGDAVVDGGPGPLLVVEKFPGSNTVKVTRDVEKALDELRPGLAGMKMDTSIFRPADFVEQAIDNLTLTIVIGMALLALALLAFLVEWRAALVSVAAILTSLVAAALVLYLTGATINALSLAGLVVAIGVVVDDAAGDSERIWSRLRGRDRGADRESGLATIQAASLQMRSAIGYAGLITLLAIAPVFFIEGVTGDFFEPLALAFTLAVVASLVVALTVTPALSALLLFRGAPARRESPLLSWPARRFDAALSHVIERPVTAFLAAGGVAVLAIALLPALSGPFIPTFKDRSLLVRLQAKPGTSLPDMRRIVMAATRAVGEVDGVERVGAEIGRAVAGDQLTDVNSGEIWARVDSGADYGATEDAIRRVVARYPGIGSDVLTYESQRIRDVGYLNDRAKTTANTSASDIDALTGASDKPVVVRVYGQNLDVLRKQAEKIKQVVSGVGGVQDPQVEGLHYEPTIEITADLGKSERYDLKPGDVRRAGAELLQGIQVGSLFEKQKVFDVIVRGTPNTRRSISDVRNLLIDTPNGGHVRLGDVATVRIRPAPTVISREAISRRLDVTADVSGRDAGSVLDDIEAKVRDVRFPLEYHAEVLRDPRQAGPGGRAWVFAVAALIAVYLLLQAAFGSWRLAGLILLTLPAAVAGGVLAALIAGGTFSLGSLIGLLAVLGIAVRSEVVMARRIRLDVDNGEAFGPELIRRGARERLAPVLTTALAVAVALVPFVVAGSEAGLEIVHPLAVVVLGGLVTSTLVTLLVVPAIYLRFGSRSAHAEGPPSVDNPAPS